MPTPRKIKAKVSEIKRYDESVMLYRLIPEIKVRFNPGQFLHLTLENYDPSSNWPESRVFSIANSNTRNDYLDILISPKGNYTRKIVNNLNVDDQIWIKLPYGDFNFKDALDKNCILIAGGTGISPFVSFLQYVLDTKFDYSLNLYYGVRNERLIIFDELFKECSEKIKNFKYEIFLEDLNSNYKAIKGILPLDKIIDDTKILNNKIYYLSGPALMIKNFEEKLIGSGINPNSIKYDRWE
jgi:NAD(P)H-flavin reductase